MADNEEALTHLQELYDLIQKSDVDRHKKREVGELYKKINDSFFVENIDYQKELQNVKKELKDIKSKLNLKPNPVNNYNYIGDLNLRDLLENDDKEMQKAEGRLYMSERNFGKFCIHTFKQVEGVIYYFFAHWFQNYLINNTYFNDFARKSLINSLEKDAEFNKKEVDENELKELQQRKDFSDTDLTDKSFSLINHFKFFHQHYIPKNEKVIFDYKTINRLRQARNFYTHRNGKNDFGELPKPVQKFINDENFLNVKSNLSKINEQVAKCLK